MSKFKVGDIVTGKDRTILKYSYGVTTDRGTFKIKRIYHNRTMDIEVIGHKDLPSQVGKTFLVEVEFFELIKPAIKKSHLPKWFSYN